MKRSLPRSSSTCTRKHTGGRRLFFRKSWSPDGGLQSAAVQRRSCVRQCRRRQKDTGHASVIDRSQAVSMSEHLSRGKRLKRTHNEVSVLLQEVLPCFSADVSQRHNAVHNQFTTTTGGCGGMIMEVRKSARRTALELPSDSAAS